MDQNSREVKKQKTETVTMSLSSDISIELHRLIFTFLEVPSLGKMVLVSHQFRNLATSDDYWSQPLENLIKNYFDSELSLPSWQSSGNGDFAKLSDRPQKSTEFLKWMRDWFHAFRESPPPVVPYTLENIYTSSHSNFFANEEGIPSEYDSDYEEDSHHELGGWVSRNSFEAMTLKEKEDLVKKANDCDYVDAISDHYYFNEVLLYV